MLRELDRYGSDRRRAVRDTIVDGHSKRVIVLVFNVQPNLYPAVTAGARAA
jgi:hypothetical protein